MKARSWRWRSLMYQCLPSQNAADALALGTLARYQHHPEILPGELCETTQVRFFGWTPRQTEPILRVRFPQLLCGHRECCNSNQWVMQLSNGPKSSSQASGQPFHFQAWAFCSRENSWSLRFFGGNFQSSRSSTKTAQIFSTSGNIEPPVLKFRSVYFTRVAVSNCFRGSWCRPFLLIDF